MQSKLNGKQVTKRPNIITAKIQTADEVRSSSGSKLVVADSPDFEALRRAHVNEISNAIRGCGMNNLLANRLKVDTNVGRLAVRLGWSFSKHYWCRYLECKLYGKTSKGLFEGLKAYRKEDGNISFFRLEEKCYKDDHRCTAYVHAFSFCCSVYEAVKATVLENENERWIPHPGKGSLYIRPLLMGSGSVLDLALATDCQTEDEKRIDKALQLSVQEGAKDQSCQADMRVDPNDHSVKDLLASMQNQPEKDKDKKEDDK
ncbi:branched-chain amino acid aminotransferase 2, chloroplastic-like protein [Tanacetum coccineum]